MHHPRVRHTLDICNRVLDYAAHFVSREHLGAFQRRCRTLEQKADATIEEAETALADFGQEIAARRIAFHERVLEYRERFGERLFHRQLTHTTKASYRRYQEQGGQFHRVYSGRDAHVFTAEERIEMYRILVELNRDILRHIRQAIVTTDEAAFERRVRELESALQKISESNAHLRELSASEQFHIRHKKEIDTFLEAVGHRFGFLANRIVHQNHTKAHENILGRKVEWPRWMSDRWEREANNE